MKSEQNIEGELRELYDRTDLSFPGEPEVTLRLSEEGLEIAQRVNNEHWWAKFSLLHANALMHSGRDEEAIAFTDKHIERVQKLNNQRSYVGYLNIKSIYATRKSQYRDSIQSLRKAFDVARTFEDKAIPANITCNIGLSLMYLGDYAGAYDMLKESIGFWEEANQPERMGVSFLNLGLVCSKLGQKDTSLNYFKKSLSCFKESPDERMEVSVRVNLASEYYAQEDYQKAREEIEIANEIVVRLGDEFRYSRVLEVLADLDIKEGDFDGAKLYLENALDIYNKYSNKHGIALVCIKISCIPSLTTKERQEYLQQSIQSANDVEVFPELAIAYEKLAELMEADGEFESACRFWKKSKTIHEEIFCEETKRRAVSAQVHREVSDIKHQLEQTRIQSEKMEALLVEVENERAKAKEESRQKSELLGHSSHDLRGIAAGVFSLLTLYQEAEEDDERHSLVAEAQESTQYLLELLQRLIDKSAIDEGRVSIETQDFNIATLMRRLISRWITRIKVKDQILDENISFDGILNSDPIRVEQVINNLMSNAVKYTPRGKHIGVELVEKEGRVKIRILDEGPGFTDEDLKLVFRPFTRLSAKPTAGEVSAGLGLNIVKEMADRLNLKIEIDNNPNGGSRITIIFPEGAQS